MSEPPSAAAGDGTDDPDELLGIMIAGLADEVEHHHTRGCPFINASAEYPDDGPRRIRETFVSTARTVAGL